MKFLKMHGAGNDYVFVDCFRQKAPADPAALAMAVSDRHRGIGSDGLILMEPSDAAEARMRMWNADGSAGEMCGNGLRCMAKYLFDRRLVTVSAFRVETASGVRDVVVEESHGRTGIVRIDMGPPVLQSEQIPTTLPGSPPREVELPLQAGHSGLSTVSGPVRVTSVSMGNPHCVLFLDRLTDDVVQTLGPAIEHHPAFPRRTNVEFVVPRSSTELEVRVWERGSGETQACGTGACAAVVAGILTERLQRRVTCRLPGGVLTVILDSDDHVHLSGPAVEVFEGDWPEE